MTSAIERVARAIWQDCHPDKPWAEQNAQVQTEFCRHALAAVRAMRDASEHMIAAGLERMPAAKGFVLPDNCRRVWHAMIDAALATQVDTAR